MTYPPQSLRTSRLAPILMVSLVVFACSPAPPSSASPDTKATSTTQTPPPNVHNALMQALDTLASTCTLAPLPTDQPRGCQALLHTVNTLTRQLELHISLHTFAVALTQNNDALAAVAVDRLHTILTPELRVLRAPYPTIHPDTAALLQTALTALPHPQAKLIAEVTVHAAMLAERRESLWRLLAQHPNVQVRAEGYRNALTFGRLVALPKLQRMALQDDPRLICAALDAPRQIPDPDSHELTQICPWAQRFVSHPNGRIAESAGRTMVWCGGAYIETLLDEGHRRVREKRFLLPFSRAFRQVCGAPRATSAQCDRNIALLQQVIEHPSMPIRVRADSLWNIYIQRQTPTTLAVLKAYANHDESAIRNRAQEAIRLMNQSEQIPRIAPSPPLLPGTTPP